MTAREALTLRGLVTIIAAGACAVPQVAHADPVTPPSAAPPVDDSPVILDVDAKPAFDWSMPSRYTASWNSYSFATGTYNADFVNPKTWTINLNACASTAVHAITRYVYTVTQFGTQWSRTFATRQCASRYTQLPALGRYTVTLQLNTDWGTSTGVSRKLSKSAKLNDWLVVSMGDSLASGEGNPDEPASDDPDKQAVWRDSRCHRSARSGPALAARRLELSDSKSSVTFVSVACSGAKIAALSHRRYAGIAPQPGFSFPAQVRQVAELVGPNAARGGRPITALLVAAGVNDLHFSNLIRRCARLTGTSCIRWGDRHTDLATLPAAYERLADEIRRQLPGTNSVALNNYPAYVFKDGGCGLLSGISEAEGEEMARVGTRLNQAITTAISRWRQTTPRWRGTSGLTAPFKPHPYCSSSSWFVELADSEDNQGDRNGTAHPNAAGHSAYATILLTTLSRITAGH